MTLAPVLKAAGTDTDAVGAVGDVVGAVLTEGVGTALILLSKIIWATNIASRVMRLIAGDGE